MISSGSQQGNSSSFLWYINISSWPLSQLLNVVCHVLPSASHFTASPYQLERRRCRSACNPLLNCENGSETTMPIIPRSSLFSFLGL